MPDYTPPAKQALATRLAHLGRPGTRTAGFVNPPVHRGSTVLSPNMADKRALQHRRLDQALIYGLLGSPTHHPLEDVVASIEGGTRCQIVSSGLAAITTPLLAFLDSGQHVLMPDSAYQPTRIFCDTMLARLGIATTYYDPCISGDGLQALLLPDTKVLFLESPGSHSFEVQDVPALAAVAHRHGAKVLMDNTWGLHFFQPFTHGVDVSIQALTKYVGGHSDIILGGITTNADEDWATVRSGALALGQFASPDDCWLALRGSRSLAVRLERQMASGIAVAEWLARHRLVARVLHPALPGAPGHAIWKRDFSGACSLFGIVFRPEITEADVDMLVDHLTLFGIGASWGGYESLVNPSGALPRTCGSPYEGQMLRIHVGLEEPADLIADLDAGLSRLS